MMDATTSEGIAADPRWRRILARDATADGCFWYSVLTTGIYCRPSCPSRAANPANVTIHDSLAEARRTGARACLRCDPDGADRAGALIAQACAAIAAAGPAPDIKAPDLKTLAAAAGLSPGYFHRLFKARTGLTPRDYAAARRAMRVRDGLPVADSVTQAIHAAGYGSHGRFYAEAPALLGMTPGRYRAGGAAETLRFAVGACALGAILVASSERGVAAILLGDDPAALVRDLQDRFPAAALVGDDAGYAALVARVVALVEQPGIGHDLPLDIRGTAFQRRVWRALRDIPAGHTVSYAGLARAIGAPAAVRAVAGACAANAHAVAIPCHRVVRTDGALSGYRWGIDRKRRLLDAEAGRNMADDDAG